MFQIPGDIVKHNGEELMARRKLLLFVAVSMLVPALMAGTGIPQGSSKAAPAAAAKAPTEKIKGTIDYMEQLGGYFVRGVEPGGESFIVNQNPKVLKTLKESGKTLTIQGYTTTQGAEYFFIQKIDGKKYKGAKP
jgi:hypothetical protein